MVIGEGELKRRPFNGRASAQIEYLKKRTEPSGFQSNLNEN